MSDRTLTTGSVFEVGRSDWIYAPYTRLEVVAIDAQAKTATLRLAHRPASPRPRLPEEVGLILGGIAVGGEGIVILPGGHIKRVPPRGPATELLTMAADFAGQQLTGDIALGLAQRRSALRSIVSLCEQLYEESDIVSSSPPRVKKTRSKQR